MQKKKNVLQKIIMTEKEKIITTQDKTEQTQVVIQMLNAYLVSS